MAGVDRCLVGYAGGVQPDPTYQNIQDFTEALWIEFDPTVTTYKQLLQVWLELHSPCPMKRQYRSAIMYLNEEQRTVAQDFCNGRNFVDVEPATKFYLGEEYHQNYLRKMSGMRR